MKFPFRKKPALDPGAQLSSPDGIRRSPADSMVTKIGSPDQKIPVDFSLPDLNAIREELYRRIDAAAARGGIDAGNAAYADQKIDDLLAGWIQEACREGKEHAHVAAQIVAVNLQNLTISYDQLSLLQSEVRVAEAQEKGFLAELLSGEVEAVKVTKEELQVALHILPKSTQLIGLDLQSRISQVAVAASGTTELAGRGELDQGEPEEVRPLRRIAASGPIERPVTDTDTGDDSSTPSTRSASS